MATGHQITGGGALGCDLLRRRSHRVGSHALALKKAGACARTLESRASSPVLFRSEVPS